MATGGVTLTEDDLSCEVCYNLYHDPKTLQCLHTFCAGCISKLADHEKEVQCPTCREKTSMAHMRSDFRIQRLLDQHIGQVGGTPAPVGYSCGMCKKTGQYIQMYCADCDKLICTTCCRIHTDTKDIANHTLLPKTDIQYYKAELQTKLDILQKAERHISISIHDTESDISTIQHEQENVMRKVDEQIDQAMKELNETRLKVHKKIADSNKNTIKSLEISKSKSIKYKVDICTNITQIQQVINEDDILMLKKVNGLIDVPTTRPTVSHGINFNKFPFVNLVALVKGVVVNDIPGFSVLINNNFVRHVEVDCYILRIQIINDKLYCACGYDGIKVFNKNCEFEKCMATDEFSCVSGLAQCVSGDLMVSSEADDTDDSPGGLHLVIDEGGCVTSQRVTEGNFYDVCIFNGIIYGLKSNGILLFHLINNQYVQIGRSDFKLNLELRDGTFCLNNEGIFVSIVQKENNRIYVYGHKEQNIQEIVTPPDQNKFILCGVDNHSNLLMIDNNRNNSCGLLLKSLNSQCVHVYIKDKDKWYTVLSHHDMDQEDLTDAVLDEDGKSIWVTSNCKLTKYKRK